MTITQMECFVEAASMGNVSRAAENLFITQQAVSSHLKTLERELGFKVFERKSKGVSLTEEGEILFAEWKLIVERLRISIDKARDFHNGQNSYIRIGLADMGKCSEDIMYGFSEYKSKYTDLHIESNLMTPAEMLQRFNTGKLDMAILYQSEFDKQAKLKCMPLHRKLLKICICMAKTHPLAEKEDLSLADLQFETLGILNNKWSLDYERKQTLFFGFQKAPVPKAKRFYSSRRELEIALVAGQCVTIVYEPMFLNEDDRLYMKYLDMPQLSSRISLYWKDDSMTTKARALGDILKEKLIQFN